jgi:hypothetical protein
LSQFDITSDFSNISKDDAIKDVQSDIDYLTT